MKRAKELPLVRVPTYVGILARRRLGIRSRDMQGSKSTRCLDLAPSLMGGAGCHTQAEGAGMFRIMQPMAALRVAMPPCLVPGAGARGREARYAV